MGSLSSGQFEVAGLCGELRLAIVFFDAVDVSNASSSMPRQIPISRKALRPLQKLEHAAVKPPSSSILKWHTLPTIEGSSLTTFRTQAFSPQRACCLPSGTFASMPAIRKWFKQDERSGMMSLDMSYLHAYGGTMVPVEQTSSVAGDTTFERGNVPLSLLLPWVEHVTSSHQVASTLTQRLYVAQASLSLLPTSLRHDLPLPIYVEKAGKGDVYDTSLWLGVAPTFTPLHRDPNPNLFVQLAGRKKVRILRPEHGDVVYGQTGRLLESVGEERLQGRDGNFRGEEMMAGRERKLMEECIWGQGEVSGIEEGWEAELEAGDGLFIPTGWWHSLKGIGDGVTASVNWWFR